MPEKKRLSEPVFSYMLVLKVPGLSLNDIIVTMFPGRNADHIIRKAKAGAPLSPEVVHRLSTAAQLRNFPDTLFAWERGFSYARELVLQAGTDRLEVRWKEFKDELGKESCSADRVKWRYLKLLSEFCLARKSTHGGDEQAWLEAAYATSYELQQEAACAGMSVSPVFARIGRVNRVAIGYTLASFKKSVDPDQYMSLLREGQAACRDAAAQHPQWIDVRFDELEYTSLLHAAGEPNQLPQLDKSLLQLVKAYWGSPVNYIISLVQTRMEVVAKKEIEKRPMYQRMQELCSSDLTRGVARLTPSVIKELDQLRIQADPVSYVFLVPDRKADRNQL